VGAARQGGALLNFFKIVQVTSLSLCRLPTFKHMVFYAFTLLKLFAFTSNFYGGQPTGLQYEKGIILPSRDGCKLCFELLEILSAAHNNLPLRRGLKHFRSQRLGLEQKKWAAFKAAHQ
jgi:hypothetical protein